jgi:iron-sulfur cluster assembly accessory protein
MLTTLISTACSLKVTESQITEDDKQETFDSLPNFKCVIELKSLLYLYLMELDYSDQLIGGGFQFKNPNAVKDCGCGKSFGV